MCRLTLRRRDHCDRWSRGCATRERRTPVCSASPADTALCAWNCQDTNTGHVRQTQQRDKISRNVFFFKSRVETASKQENGVVGQTRQCGTKQIRTFAETAGGWVVTNFSRSWILIHRSHFSLFYSFITHTQNGHKLIAQHWQRVAATEALTSVDKQLWWKSSRVQCRWYEAASRPATVIQGMIRGCISSCNSNTRHDTRLHLILQQNTRSDMRLHYIL